MRLVIEGYTKLTSRTAFMVKALLAACLALAFCLCVAAPGRALAAEWTVGCSTDAKALYVDDTFTVNITATGDGIASLSGTLSYDHDLLELTDLDLESSQLSGDDLYFYATTDTDRLAFFGNDADSSEGLLICQATFKCKATTDDAKVELTGASGLRDGEYEDVDAASASAADVHVYPSTYAEIRDCKMATDGTFGTLFSLYLPDEVLAIEGALLEVTTEDGTVLCAVPLTSGAETTVSSVYDFSCLLSPAWLCDKMTVRIYAPDRTPLKFRGWSGTNVTSTGESTTMAYWFYNTTTKPTLTAFNWMLTAMLYYGTCCQALFDHNVSTSAVTGIHPLLTYWIERDVSKVTTSALESQKPTWTWSSMVDFAGCNIAFGATTGLFATFEIDEGTDSDYRYYVDGKEVACEVVSPSWSGADASKTYVALSKTGIRANNLDKAYEFKVVRTSDEKVAATCELSARGYAWMCLSDDSASDALKSTCQYLCAYNTEADAYITSDLGDGADDVLSVDAKSGTLMQAYKTHTVGDINDNSQINIVDAQIALDMSNGVWTTAGSEAPYDILIGELSNGWDQMTLARAADMNGDGTVDATDARAIQVHALAA